MTYLKNKLNNHEFIKILELLPPKGTDVSGVKKATETIGDLIDAIFVPEMPDGVMRLSALGCCALLLHSGIEPILEIQCRDRNRLAIQGDMLSASALGIVNIAVSDSEEPSVGDHPEAVAVNDLEPLDLLHAVSAMQEGKDLAGQPLQGSPEFVIGIRLQSIAPGVKPEKEMTMLRQFSNLGVTFVITPPVFEIDPLLALRDTIKSEKISIIPSILLLKSVGMARYIQAHSEQIHIPESIINRLQHCDSIPREVAKITEELMSSFRNNGFSGVLISSRGWESLIKEILEEQ